jgi:hypothetical protein
LDETPLSEFYQQPLDGDPPFNCLKSLLTREQTKQSDISTPST